MDPVSLRLLLDWLPADQRPSAAGRIEQAERLLWTQIELLRLKGQTGLSHEDDLVGITPNGECAFLPRAHPLPS